MELEVKKVINIEEGKHTGEVTKLEERTEPYHYIDVYIKIDGEDFEIKYGAPATLSERSKLGRLVSQFTELNEGEKLDLDKTLIGQKVQFMTMNEEKEGNIYARVVEDSVKPLKGSK